MIVDLIKTVSLLFSLTLLYGVIINQDSWKRLNILIASGSLFGLIAVSSMMMPLNFVPGIIFDPRSVIISLGGVFGGPIVAFISVLIAASYRIWLGGAGAIAGTLVIVVSGISGVGYYYLQKHFFTEIKYSHLLVFGILTHLFAILCMGVLPSGLIWKVASNLIIPFFLIYPLTTVFLGALIRALEKTVEMKINLEEKGKHLQKTLYNLQNEVLKRKRAGQKIRLERDNFFNILEAMDDGVSIINKDFEIKYVNPVILKEFGLIEDRKYYEYFHAKKESCPWGKTSHVYEGKTVQWEWYSEINGKTYDIIETPLKNFDGSLSKLEIFHDITYRKQAEEELETYREHLEEQVKERTAELEYSNKEIKKSQKAMHYLLEDVNEAYSNLKISNTNLEKANKDMESFTYSVSHDLRSPLRAVLGFSNKLYDRIEESADKETQRLLTVIIENTIKMQTLISDLLNFSRMGRTKLNIEEINMHTLVSDICSTFMENTEGTNPAFNILALPNASASRPMIKQVFINLIDNAVKFTRTVEFPKITIGSQISESGNTYYVKDNGSGFNMKYSSKIFDIFTRLHNEKSIEGTGVGLAIVKQIIERHGGTIQVESESEKGTAFYFTLNKNIELEK